MMIHAPGTTHVRAVFGVWRGGRGRLPHRTCPKCAQDGGRDQSARAILHTAGVLAMPIDESQSEIATEAA